MGEVSVDAFIQNETIWITANQMAVLFDKSESTIRKHINNVLDEGELDRENNTQKVRVDGVKQLVAFYNLDTIISVGYRVNSRRATQFRIWATSVLKEYMIKGFAMDDERLKQGKIAFGKDYNEVISVSVKAGATAFTRIPYAPQSKARERTNPLTACFVALYAACFQSPFRPDTEDVAMNTPLVLFNAGKTSFAK